MANGKMEEIYSYDLRTFSFSIKRERSTRGTLTLTWGKFEHAANKISIEKRSANNAVQAG